MDGQVLYRADLANVRLQRPGYLRNRMYRDLIEANERVFAGDHRGASAAQIRALVYEWEGLYPLHQYIPLIHRHGVLQFGDVRVNIEIEMLQPLNIFYYREFFPIQGRYRRRALLPRSMLCPWKLILAVIYAADEIIEPSGGQYTATTYARALAILALNQAEQWLFKSMTFYFRMHFDSMVEGAQHRDNDDDARTHAQKQDQRLDDLNTCITMYNGIPNKPMVIPQWRFGYWAVRVVDGYHLIYRHDRLSEPLKAALKAAAAHARETGEKKDGKTIFLDILAPLLG